MTQEEWIKKHTMTLDIPVKLFIRITKKPKEIRERALLILKDEKGKEYTLQSNCPTVSEVEDLTICELEKDE